MFTTLSRPNTVFYLFVKLPHNGIFGGKHNIVRFIFKHPHLTMVFTTLSIENITGQIFIASLCFENYDAL